MNEVWCFQYLWKKKPCTYMVQFQSTQVRALHVGLEGMPVTPSYPPFTVHITISMTVDID